MRTFFTHRSVSTFDRVPFQLTDERTNVFFSDAAAARDAAAEEMRVELSVLQSERMKLHAMARTATARLDALVATRETGEDGTSTDAGAVAVRDARATAAAFAAEAAAARDRAATAETAAREALRARDDALRELEIDRAARSSDASDRRAAFARVVADETKAETESGTIARLREALAEVERERERDRIERAADADLRVELEHINASLVEEAMKCTEIEKKMRAEIKRARRELRDARAGERRRVAARRGRRGAFYTLVPIRPRSRGERRSLRTFAVVSLRPALAFNPRPRRLSTPTDAFELHPDIRSYGTTPRTRRRPSAGSARISPKRARRARNSARARAIPRARWRRSGRFDPR